MTRQRHTEAEWKPWGISREQRYSVAKDTAGTIYFLPLDGANKILPGDTSGKTAKQRVDAKELLCLIPGCGTFASAVSARNKRDHFRHRKLKEGEALLPGHDPESYEHQLAKHGIAKWFQDKLGKQVKFFQVDEYRVVHPITGCYVEPDVYVELLNGLKIAVEYQASPGTLEYVKEKTLHYRACDVQVWWLFGPGRKTCHISKRTASDMRVDLIPTQMELAKLKAPYFWYSHDHNRIGTPAARVSFPIVPSRDELWADAMPRSKPYLSGPRPLFRYTHLHGCGLEACEIDLATGELMTPTTQAIRSDDRRRAAEFEMRRRAAREAKQAQDMQIELEVQAAATATVPILEVVETSELASPPSVELQSNGSISPPAESQEVTKGLTVSVVLPESPSRVAEASALYPAPTRQFSVLSVLSRWWHKIRQDRIILT